MGTKTRSVTTNVTAMSKDETIAAQEQEENQKAPGLTDGEDEALPQRSDNTDADIKLPENAKSGEFIDVQHDKEVKTIKVPSGAKGGDEVTVRFVKSTEEAPQPRLCGCL